MERREGNERRVTLGLKLIRPRAPTGNAVKHFSSVFLRVLAIQAFGLLAAQAETLKYMVIQTRKMLHSVAFQGGRNSATSNLALQA